MQGNSLKAENILYVNGRAFEFDSGDVSGCLIVYMDGAL